MGTFGSEQFDKFGIVVTSAQSQNTHSVNHKRCLVNFGAFMTRFLVVMLIRGAIAKPAPCGDNCGSANEISATSRAFAAIKADGTVATWGSSLYGVDSSSVQEQLSVVNKIYATDFAFAAVKTDGTVVTWGNSLYGGDSSSVQEQLSAVDRIYATDYAFAAVKTDGTVVTSGSSLDGADSSSVQGQLSVVKKIYATRRAFAAVKADGTVVTWANSSYGGDCCSVVQEQLSSNTKATKKKQTKRVLR